MSASKYGTIVAPSEPPQYKTDAGWSDVDSMEAQYKRQNYNLDPAATYVIVTTALAADGTAVTYTSKPITGQANMQPSLTKNRAGFWNGFYVYRQEEAK